ncbi:hypothetical protein MCHI_000459 [Candidatus Magnetoovum chiemensis]|nr:hypothetical protein MCHI_000459 [Candidatus Magnetoovum chiemensis]
MTMKSLEDKKLSDMTGKGLKNLIRDVVLETIDTDYGLELRPEVIEELKESMKEKQRGEVYTLYEVKKRLIARNEKHY